MKCIAFFLVVVRYAYGNPALHHKICPPLPEWENRFLRKTNIIVSMKKSFIWPAIAGLALLCIAVACNKDLQQETTGLWGGKEVTASFFGRIQDESGLALPNAVVSIGNVSVTADANGVFLIPPQQVNSARAILTVTKNGYWKSQRTMFVQNNSQNQANFTLMAKQLLAVINGQYGGTINMNGGSASIKFKAGSFLSGGQAITNNVLIYGRYIDPTNPNLRELIPGDLRGIRSNGNEEILTSYGMLGVELTDQNGAPVTIDPNLPAEIRADIQAEQLADAPASVPLWHFDEQEGLWVEEGEAQRQGNQYVGQVSHFSWWNYDATAPAIKISGQIINQNGSPITDVHVWACPVNYSLGCGCGHGMPDDRGFFCGLATKDVPLTITIQLYGASGCSETIYTTTVGPFSADTDLGVITINLGNLPSITTNTISGRLLDCNGNALTSGYAYLNNHTVLSLDQNGAFEYVLTYCSNMPVPALTIAGFDATNGKQSQPISLPPAPQVNFGDISVCDDIAEYVKYSLDGAPEVTAFLPPNDSSIVTIEYAFISGTSPTGGISLQFLHNNTPQNNIPLSYLSVNNLYAYNNNLQVTTNLQAIPPSGFVNGTFSGTFVDISSGQAHTISGSYQLQR